MSKEKTVLVVDDHDSIVQIVNTILFMEGYTVIHGCSGEDGLYMNENHPFPIHLLITDIRMGRDCNGCDLAEAMRMTRPDIKVLYMSGYSDDNRVNAEVKAGTALFIGKPFPPSLLLAKVEEALSEKTILRV